MSRWLDSAGRRKLRATFILVPALLVLCGNAQAAEYRAFWVDAWGAGLHNQSQVETLLGKVGDPNSGGRIRDVNCNAVIVQVRRRADVCYPSGMGEPYMSGLSPSNFNALQAIINAAHDTTGGKQRVEVHAWIVAFKTAKGLVYSRHSDPNNPDNYWPTRLASGGENPDGAFDPGHPRFQQYLVDVCMDLVTNFNIDGLHYDYIRFEANTEGYNPTSIARYNQRYGLSGQPSSSSEQFKQWRRDQITSVVRQVYARVQATKPSVKVSASLVTWNPSPTSSTRSAFMGTRPYYDVYSDWDAWMQEGILDLSVPMTYYDQAIRAADYQRWMNFQKDRKFNRQNIVGPGIYLNSLSNAILQLNKTREASPAGNYTEGFAGYSYRVPFSGGTWPNFAPSLVAQVTPTPDVIPDMPWKTAPTMGHIMGTVTYAADGTWADHTYVTLTGPVNRGMYVDGTGFYAFIDLPPGAYTVVASRDSYADAVAVADVALGQVTGNMYKRDMALSVSGPPVVFNVQATNITNTSATINWNTNVPATSQVLYGNSPSYAAQTPLNTTPVSTHAVTLSNLQPDTLHHYRARSTNEEGAAISPDRTFTTAGIPEILIDNRDAGWANTSLPGNNWTVGSSGSVPKIGPDYLYTAGVTSTLESAATHSCTWTPVIQVPGLYDVYVYYQLGANRTTSAPYTVVYDEGELVSIQNQYSPINNQGGWFLIGQDLPFAAGASGYVQLSNNTGSTALVSADAARFVYQADNSPPTRPLVMIVSHGDYTDSLDTLRAFWEADDPESGIKRFEYRIREQHGQVIREWTDAGWATEVTATGLAMAPGGTYFFDVRATNHFDLVSEVGSSDGILVFTFDTNQDGFVNNIDFNAFLACFGSPNVPYPSDPALDCARFDVDQDGDVDQVDFALFQRCLSGSQSLNLACVD